MLAAILPHTRSYILDTTWSSNGTGPAGLFPAKLQERGGAKPVRLNSGFSSFTAPLVSSKGIRRGEGGGFVRRGAPRYASHGK